MKARKAKRLGVLLLALLVSALAGCAYSAKGDPITTEVGVKQAFWDRYVQDESMAPFELSVRYIGRFDGFDAVYVDGYLDYTQGFSQETVGGMDFLYATGQHLLLFFHGDGKLYTLQEALDGKRLDMDGLRAVHAAHREAEPGRYQEKEKETETEDMRKETTDGEILLAYFETYQPACGLEELSLVRVGTFGGCDAVFVNGPFAHRDVITTQTVGGLKFVYPDSQTMRIYRDGSVYTLPEAWEAGLLSRSALTELHKAFGGESDLATE